ncbi:MAG TPA: chromophore lyase CpcT/CpeT [Steroidobacteraceae bacterium]|nr:chromophore lyase CpcT/CpeT [Steroidobacteraceae bacterium]
MKRPMGGSAAIRLRRAAAVGALLALLPYARLPAQGSAEETLAGALMQDWAGAHDTAEQVIFDRRGPAFAAPSVRLSTHISPVSLPWLGAHVLYLEEALQDDPQHPRRQVLLRLSLDTQLRPEQVVRVRQYTFREPGLWRGLAYDPHALAALRREDLQTMPGCDLLLARDGGQFSGGTLGRDCVAPPGDPQRYVDFSLLVGEHVYWYRKRQFRFSDDDLAVESVGYDWPPLHQARLFTCGLRWSPPGYAAQGSEGRWLAPAGLADQGLPVTVATPDGHRYEVELLGGTSAYVPSHGLLLMLHAEPPTAPAALAWAPRDARRIEASLDGLFVQCALVAPSSGS